LSMRLICSLMEKELGQPMVVKNVVGADGATCYTQWPTPPPMAIPSATSSIPASVLVYF
jgi:tripartite-type tricarboxylate transporter receptor subunit TctC